MLVKLSAITAAFAVMLLLFSSISGYMTSGILRESNSIYIFGIAIALCFGASWMFATGLLIGSVVAFFRRSRANGVILLCSALIIAVLPFVSRLLGVRMATIAERIDVESHGIDRLRSDVTELIARSKDSHYTMRWFGYEVPAEDLPDAIAQLSRKAAYVTVSKDGVTIVTDGMGGWRGGYLIQPEGISSGPDNARLITDGVYYVIAQ